MLENNTVFICIYTQSSEFFLIYHGLFARTSKFKSNNINLMTELLFELAKKSKPTNKKVTRYDILECLKLNTMEIMF